MARTVTQSIFAGSTPTFGATWLFLMADGTMWLLNPTNGNWTQAPGLPGSRIPTNIAYVMGCAYACASDGTIWSGVIQPAFVWAQVASTPP